MNESYLIFQKLYPSLKDDIIFLGSYSNVLSATGHNREAINILESLIKIDNGNLFYLQLANCYYQQKEFCKAENAYLFSIYEVPNRFIPRFYLFNLYIHTNQIQKALNTGKIILSLPIKIPSPEIIEIKKNVFNDIRRIAH